MCGLRVESQMDMLIYVGLSTIAQLEPIFTELKAFERIEKQCDLKENRDLYNTKSYSFPIFANFSIAENTLNRVHFTMIRRLYGGYGNQILAVSNLLLLLSLLCTCAGLLQVVAIMTNKQQFDSFLKTLLASQNLKNNPREAVPVILKRLKKKVNEWRDVKKKNPEWNDFVATTFAKSFDNQSELFKLYSKSLYTSKELFKVQLPTIFYS